MHLCFKQISEAYLSSKVHYILCCTTLISQNSLFILSNKASFGLHFIHSLSHLHSGNCFHMLFSKRKTQLQLKHVYVYGWIEYVKCRHFIFFSSKATNPHRPFKGGRRKKVSNSCFKKCLKLLPTEMFSNL